MDGEQLVGQGVSPGEWEQWMGNSWWDRGLLSPGEQEQWLRNSWWDRGLVSPRCQ